MEANNYYFENHKKIEAYLTPTEEGQIILILSNECPHNKGWKYDGHSHNDDAYKCRLCGHIEFY